jgi:hypothetical protein
MSQQTQGRNIDILIPLAEVLRINQMDKDANTVIANHQAIKIAILRGYAYAGEPKHDDNDRNKLVFTGNPCHKVVGVIFEQMNVSNVARILYGSQQQPSQQQAQQQDVQMILVALEELPRYNIACAYLPLKYLYISSAQATQDKTAIDTRIIEAIKSGKRDSYALVDNNIDKLIEKLQITRNERLDNLIKALEGLRRSYITSLKEYYIKV